MMRLLLIIKAWVPSLELAPQFSIENPGAD
jgi:hypothetical protein